ncbi:hypothetical protein LTR86_009620 [Recurvomyces mirabilis]|nr:hypothetical protein LTR86_009620 [Recurvomyces mirabilis]
MAPLNLTLGIELEFLALYHKDSAWLPHRPEATSILPTDNLKAQNAIFHALQDAGIPVADPFDDDLNVTEEPHSHWSFETETLRLSPAEAAAMPETYVVECIELRSRVFSGMENWQGEVQRVMDVLIRVQDALACRFISNASTGLHVHIGNGKGSKIPFETAKNVLTFMTAFERCLDEIHPVDRIGHPTDYCVKFCHAPLSFFHRANGQTGPEAGLLDWLANIQRKGMIEKASYGHNSSLNLENLYPDEGESRWADELKGTIEFRQHMGSLKALEICAWATPTAKIVEFCHCVSDGELLALCAQGVDPNYDVHDLLAHIGCEPDLIQFFGNPGTMYEGPDPSRATVFSPRSIAACMEQNKIEEAARFEPEAVCNVIENKDYGLDASVTEASIPQEVVARCFQQACAKVASMGVDNFPSRADVAAPARALVFEHIAEMYCGAADPRGYWYLS